MTESSVLFPPDDQRRQADNRLTDLLVGAYRSVQTGSVTPTLDMAGFRASLAAFDFKSPRPAEEVIDWVIAQLKDGLVHVTHPRYFGLFNPTPTFPAQLADRITAIFNPQLATHTTSPVAVEIEAHVIEAIAARVGFDQATGHFTTGGAEANFTALLCALAKADANFAAQGIRCFAGQPVFYVSQDAHKAWFKIAVQAGMGREAVRLVPTDDTGRMVVDALRQMIEADLRADMIPVMIVATAGTTNAGMIDPLGQCATIAQETHLWLHIDAAWGGGLIASDEHRIHMIGLRLADSITIDAHKWFATTMGCGMFLTRHPQILSSAFASTADYMPSRGADDPYLMTVQWSRRFLGLRLFLALALAGWQGYAQHVEHAIDIAASLRRALVADGWSVVNDSPLAVLCIEPPAGSADVRTIVDRVLASGRAWVSVTEFVGRSVIRACITSGEASDSDIRVLVEELNLWRT